MPENSAFSYVPFCLLPHMCLSKDVSNKEKKLTLLNIGGSHTKRCTFLVTIVCTLWYRLVLVDDSGRICKSTGRIGTHSQMHPRINFTKRRCKIYVDTILPFFP